MWLNPKPNDALLCVSTNDQMIQSYVVPLYLLGSGAWIPDLNFVSPLQRTVRSFSNEDLHIQKYGELVSSSEKSSKQLAYGIATFQGLTNAALNSIVGGTVLAGGLLLGAGHLNSSDLMSFLGATQMLQKSLGGFHFRWLEYRR